MNSSQQQIIRQIIAIGKRRGASKAAIKAALETGAVESNFTNSARMSDHDSQGWRQERASLYKDPTNLNHSINRFFDETKKVRGSSGEIAAAVQRPAAQYRGRYAEHSREAEDLLRRYGGGGVSDTPTGGSASGSSSDRSALLQQYLQQRGNPTALLTLATGLKADTATTPARPVSAPTSSGGKDTTALKNFDGKKVSGWIADELNYARAHGWKGTVSSGYRSYADQARIYNSGVRPAAKPGQSNHERKGYLQGAVDVTDAAQLAKILQRKGSRLKWAGSKDPPHFSVPRNGSY